MPVIIAAIIGGVMSALGTLVGRILVSLGIGFVVYQGVDLMASWIRDRAMSALSGLPVELFTVLSLLQVPAVINVYFSAWMTGLVIGGLTGGSVTRRIQKAPGG